MLFTPFGCFSRNGTFCQCFYYFPISKKLKKNHDSEENICLFTPFDCFSRNGTLFYLSFGFKIVENMYRSEHNVCCSLFLTVFLVRVHFFTYCSNFKIGEKYTLPRKIYVFHSF